jgi:glutamate-1-semialdehyde 2,1-aminomutase
MTAGLWSLKRLSNGLYRQLSGLGAALADGLADAARQAGVALQVNGIGSALTPFFTSGAVTNYQTALRADAAKYGTFFKGMIARGVYPPPSQFEAWFLSGAHTARDVDRTIKAAREAMNEVAGH